jgi:hypothetical protein
VIAQKRRAGSKFPNIREGRERKNSENRIVLIEERSSHVVSEKKLSVFLSQSRKRNVGIAQ